MLNTDITINSIDDTAEAETLRRNIEFYCRTPRGSLPQMRLYGIDFSVLDGSFETVRRKLTVDIISGIRDTFNVQIRDIKITANENGCFTAAITI